MSDCQSVLQNHGACFREPFNMIRGTIQVPLRDNRCSVAMFVYGQTIVFVQANNCLAIGKSLKIYLIVPQRMPYDSSMDGVWFPDGCRSVPRRMPFGPSMYPFSFSQPASELRYRTVNRLALYRKKCKI